MIGILLASLSINCHSKETMLVKIAVCGLRKGEVLLQDGFCLSGTCMYHRDTTASICHKTSDRAVREVWSRYHSVKWIRIALEGSQERKGNISGPNMSSTLRIDLTLLALRLGL
jgi:hypothetical protein